MLGRSYLSTTVNSLKSHDLLKSIPAVNEILHSEALSDLRASHSHTVFVRWVRLSIDKLREELLGGRETNLEQVHDRLAQYVRALAESDGRRSMQAIVNATGILIHTNLGRAPLSERAIARMLAAANYTNLEFDLETGKRCRRAGRVAELLCQLTGAEDALVVNNCAAATVLALGTLAFGKEVIISRSQLVEIGGGFRLPDVFRSAGVTLREVGTTNRTYCRDYEAAVSQMTGAILRVHHSNFSQVGFVSSPSLRELVAAQAGRQFPIIDDLGSGNVYNLSAYGLAEPSVIESVNTGSDLCLFSGDKLFGGPQCGIILGKTSWIEHLRSNPTLRAMRADKITLAALEGTVEDHLAGRAFQEIPILRMLCKDTEIIRAQCEKVIREVSEHLRARIALVPCISQVGGGALPSQSLPSYGLAVSVPHLNRFARLLRSGSPAVVGRLVENKLVLDLRTVHDREQVFVARRLNELLNSFENLNHK